MNPEEQIKEVQSVLDRLTRFRYVNGWAAFTAGILCIITYILICINYHVPFVIDNGDDRQLIASSLIIEYALILGGLLVLAAVVCGAIILLSLPKDLTGAAWRNLMRLIALFALYVFAGAALLWSILNGTSEINLGLLRSIPPMMCIFYGLAQIHASNISLPTLKYLGICILLCGITGCLFPYIGWFLWAVGFGLGHIAAGILIVKKNKF